MPRQRWGHNVGRDERRGHVGQDPARVQQGGHDDARATLEWILKHMTAAMGFATQEWKSDPKNVERQREHFAWLNTRERMQCSSSVGQSERDSDSDSNGVWNHQFSWTGRNKKFKFLRSCASNSSTFSLLSSPFASSMISLSHFLIGVCAAHLSTSRSLGTTTESCPFLARTLFSPLTCRCLWCLPGWNAGVVCQCVRTQSVFFFGVRAKWTVNDFQSRSLDERSAVGATTDLRNCSRVSGLSHGHTHNTCVPPEDTFQTDASLQVCVASQLEAVTVGIVHMIKDQTQPDHLHGRQSRWKPRSNWRESKWYRWRT